MDLSDYRQSDRERERIGDLMKLVPDDVETILDVGARDGFISVKLADTCKSVTALDLTKPSVACENVACVAGNVTSLDFPDECFDAVLCAEVLEHLPPESLETACKELRRVAKRHVIVGVPYKQDTRIARSTCYTCGEINPPWAHVNEFDRQRLLELFPEMKVEKSSFVGMRRERTNALSTLLLDLAGNPYGTYDQDEPCVHCGAQLKPPPSRTLLQRAAAALAIRLNDAQSRMSAPEPNWIHILFARDA